MNASRIFHEQAVAIYKIAKAITEHELKGFEPVRRAEIVAEMDTAYYEGERNTVLEQVTKRRQQGEIEVRQAAIDATNLEDTELPEQGGECSLCLEDFKQKDSLKKCPKYLNPGCHQSDEWGIQVP